MRDAIERAMLMIHERRFTFVMQDKMGKSGLMDDKVSDVDKDVEKMFKKLFDERFPGIGIIGEEGIRKRSRHPNGLWLTGDPLDGTKAFGRKQSYGIATMIALCSPTKIISAYVGDPHTREVYGYRPYSRTVHRIGLDGQRYALKIDPEIPLRNQYLMLRDHPEMYSSLGTAISRPAGFSRKGNLPGLFKNIEVSGGSIGIMMSRLWKGEIGGAILHGGKTTPWDLSPILGISQNLGFMFVDMEWLMTRGRIRRCEPILRKITYIAHETLVIHRSRASELLEWVQSYKSCDK